MNRMLRKIIISSVLAALLVSFHGCSYKVIPLKGIYPDKNFEAVSDKSKDAVWDNIIDFFAKKGLSIKLIDRSSGLIVSDKTLLPISIEDAKGKLKDPSAWVVMSRVISPHTTAPIERKDLTGEWNIRIKSSSENKTIVNVNLIIPQENIDVVVNKTVVAKPLYATTGVFEKMIFEIIK